MTDRVLTSAPGIGYEEQPYEAPETLRLTVWVSRGDMPRAWEIDLKIQKINGEGAAKAAVARALLAEERRLHGLLPRLRLAPRMRQIVFSIGGVEDDDLCCPNSWEALCHFAGGIGRCEARPYPWSPHIPPARKLRRFDKNFVRGRPSRTTLDGLEGPVSSRVLTSPSTSSESAVRREERASLYELSAQARREERASFSAVPAQARRGERASLSDSRSTSSELSARTRSASLSASPSSSPESPVQARRKECASVSVSSSTSSESPAQARREVDVSFSTSPARRRYDRNFAPNLPSKTTLCGLDGSVSERAQALVSASSHQAPASEPSARRDDAGALPAPPEPRAQILLPIDVGGREVTARLAEADHKVVAGLGRSGMRYTVAEALRRALGQPSGCPLLSVGFVWKGRVISMIPDSWDVLTRFADAGGSARVLASMPGGRGPDLSVPVPRAGDRDNPPTIQH